MNDELIAFGNEVKALGNGKIGGVLVRMTTPDDPDLSDDFFSVKSDVRFPSEVDVYYNHGLDETLKKRVIGKAKLSRLDNADVWAETQLNLRDEYEKAIYQMAEAGKLGYSSGALPHLVEREPAGKAYFIKTWVIGEASLTPTPAEFRNTVVTLKSLSPDAALPDTDEPTHKQMEKKIMPDEIKTAVAEAVAAALAQRDDESKKKAEQDAAIKAAEDAGYQKAVEELKSAKSPAFNSQTSLGFSEEKDAVPAFKHWVKTGQVNGGLITPDSSFAAIKDAKTAWNVTTGASGGYLVPDPLYNQIVAKRNLSSWVRQAPVQKFTTPADHLIVPVEDTAHTAFVKTAEAAAYDENEGTVAQKDLILYKYTKMQKVSEEFISYQGTNFDAWLAEALGRAEAVTENSIYTTGDGTGDPQGVLIGAISSSITLGTVDVITAAEIASLIGKLGAGYNVPAECGFLMANATKWYLKGVVNAGPYAFSTPAGGPDLFGYNAYVSDDMAPYTTEGDKPVLFGNFSMYGMVEKPGMIVQRNPYLYMANGQIGLFASIFRGGAVLQSEAFYYLTAHA